MDEITYWIYTKRAPCLMKYDMSHKQSKPIIVPQTSSIIHTISDETTIPKTKKRKLSIFDDDPETPVKQANMFFNTSSQKNKTPAAITQKSDSPKEKNFNVKKSSKQKPKRIKLQNNGLTPLKPNRIVSSTPKTSTGVRRSTRKPHNMLNGSLPLESTSNGSGGYAKELNTTNVSSQIKQANKANVAIKNNDVKAIEDNSKVTNGQFEHLSDVSGFTATYIRSTKSAKKNGTTAKRKNNKDLYRESRWSLQKDQTKQGTITHKAADNFLDSSKESSPNQMTPEKNCKINKNPQRTSELRNLETKNKSKLSKDIITNGTHNSTLDSNLQSPNGRRYPSRHKNSTKEEFAIFNYTLNSSSSSPKKRRSHRKVHNNDFTEETPIITRSRSGKLPYSPEKLDCTISTEQNSEAINVASPQNKKTTRKYKSGTPKKNSKSGKSLKNSSLRNSLREKSGFSACFSDSDDDKPLKPLKFFC